jgi:hypothetical protein
MEFAGADAIFAGQESAKFISDYQSAILFIS